MWCIYLYIHIYIYIYLFANFILDMMCIHTVLRTYEEMQQLGLSPEDMQQLVVSPGEFARWPGSGGDRSPRRDQ